MPGRRGPRSGALGASLAAGAVLVLTSCGGSDPDDLGIVWSSAVDDARVNRTDEPPGFTVAGVDVQVQLYVYDEDNDLGCRWELDVGSTCLVAQVSFDVPEETETFYGDVSVIFDDAVTAEGRQVGCAYPTEEFWVAGCAADALPGTTDTVLVGYFPDAGPGSMLSLSVNGVDSPDASSDPMVIEVPGIEEFQQLDWDIG